MIAKPANSTKHAENRTKTSMFMCWSNYLSIIFTWDNRKSLCDVFRITKLSASCEGCGIIDYDTSLNSVQSCMLLSIDTCMWSYRFMDLSVICREIYFKDAIFWNQVFSSFIFNVFFYLSRTRSWRKYSYECPLMCELQRFFQCRCWWHMRCANCDKLINSIRFVCNNDWTSFTHVIYYLLTTLCV